LGVDETPGSAWHFIIGRAYLFLFRQLLKVHENHLFRAEAWREERGCLRLYNEEWLVAP
jgi:hypothetical protein